MIVALALAAALAVVTTIVFALRMDVPAKALSLVTPLQVWLPGAPFSGSWMLSLALLPAALLRLRRADLGGVMVLVSLVCGWNLTFALFTSGATNQYRLLQWAVVFSTFLVLRQGARAEGDVVRSCLRFAAPVAIAQALATLLFRLRPDIESSYQTSSLGAFVTGPLASALFSTAGNNVLAEEKAGGFLLNGNEASAIMGLFCCVFAAAAAWYGSRWFSVPAICSLAGAFATGSKSGLALALVMPLVALFLFAVARRGQPLLRRLLLVVSGLPPVLIGLFAALRRSDDYVTESGESLDLRSKLWALSWDVIGRHPIQGSGPSAFVDETTLYGARYLIPAGLPPHNFLLGAWMSTGLIGAALQAAVIAFLLVQCLVTVVRGRGRVALAAAFLFGGTLWVLIHGMGDNTTFYGGAMSLGVFAVLTILSQRLAQEAKAARGAALSSGQAQAQAQASGSGRGTPVDRVALAPASARVAARSRASRRGLPAGARR